MGKSCCPDAAGDCAERGAEIRSCSFLRPRPLSNGCMSSLEEKLHAAETFLGGGTDFQTPLAEAERLMREGGFENADIAFITDGECSLPETCVEMLQKAQSELRFTVTGILLDEGNAGMDFSLKPFCQNIYRTSELTGDQIVGEIVLDRV